MIPLLPRGSRLPALLLFVTAAGAALPPGAASAAESVAATRGIPSSLSARYGSAIPLGSLAPGGYLIPTRSGFEVREASLSSGDSLVATFRSAGRIGEAALSGSTVWLAAGSRGLLAVDLAAPASPALVGSYGGLGAITHVAAAPAGQALAAASDSTVHFFRETAPAELSLLDSRALGGGREVRRIAARNDSFLVAAERPAAVPRLYLTLFRVRAGQAPELLWDFQANAHQVLDLAWRGSTAFLADGDNGIQPFDLPTRQLRPAKLFSTPQFVQALDADDSLVVAVGGKSGFARFRRGGTLGDSLTEESYATLPFNPVAIALVGSHAIIASDSEAERPEPEDVGRSVIQDHDLATGVTAAPVGATGRVRRAAIAGGLAYIADYTGGLRIYRAVSSDSSLIGALPPTGGARTYDVALDAPRRIAYLASGTAGVEVVDVSDTTAPARIASVPLPGLTRCVAVIGDTLIAAGWDSQPTSSGVTFVDVVNPGAPFPRGSVSVGAAASIRDPRALASRDTVLFVADDLSGVISVTFGDPDAPGIRGVPSGVVGTRDVHVLGTLLLAATRLRGLEVVDVSNPAAPVLVAEVALPPVYGVTRQGSAAVAFLGDEGAAVVDLTSPASPSLRGMLDAPGFPRHGAWSGDALLAASLYGLERYTLPASLPGEPSLTLSYDDRAAQPRVMAAWPSVSLSGLVGLNLYRETVGSSGPSGQAARLNGPLLPPGATSYDDPTIPSAGLFRYRLEAVLSDGAAREVAVGTIFAASTARMGRPYPNPFRPSSAVRLAVPYRSQPAAGAAVRVRVHDVRGRLVRSIATPAPPAGGFGSVSWDGRDDRGVPVASGLYFVRVRAPGIDDAQNVVLLR